MANNDNRGLGSAAPNVATATTKDEGAATPGDNRGADDIDGNKAGAPAGNKAPGPDEPAPA